jgi:AAA family ATP:ADP antiporter
LNNSDSESKSFLGIAREDFKITFVSVAYIFFVLCSYYVIKPVRGSLGMELGKDNIPILSLCSMFVLIGSNAIYCQLVGKFKRDTFIPLIMRFFAICLVVFWAIFSFVFPVKVEVPDQTKIADTEVVSQDTNAEEPLIGPIEPKPEEKIASENAEVEIKEDGNLFFTNTSKAVAIAVFYLWVGVFALIAVSMFWSFMNDVFSVKQSKRLYAIIGYGGLTGAVAGSSITSLLVNKLGTANLLLVALVILYPSVWCMKYIHRAHLERQKNNKEHAVIKEEESDSDPVHPPRPWDGMLAVYRTPILIFMALEMFLFTFSTTLFYQQLYEMINQVFAGSPDATTSFFADFFGKINIISLFAQFFVTKLVMMIPNPIIGLLIFPFIQSLASVFMLFSPALGIVSWGLIINNAINYSTGRAIRELVYIPLNRDQKYQGKGFIDTVIFRMGDGISAIVLIGGLEFFSYGIWIDWTILASMALQFYVIINIARLYSRIVKQTSVPQLGLNEGTEA